MKNNYFLVALLLLTSSLSYADGVITQITMSSPEDGTHPSIVQIRTQEGFDVANCNSTWAAIRVDEGNQHLISYALAAYVAKDSIQTELNSSDRYFQDRCTIKRISTHY